MPDHAHDVARTAMSTHLRGDPRPAAVDLDLRPDAQASAWPRILWVTGALLLVTMLVHIAALTVTGGPVTGAVSLRKPATFAETGWLAAWSTALILPALRTRAWQRHLVGTSVVLFGVVETTVIGIQAWRGVPSHHNFTTPLDAALMRGGAAGTAGIFLIGMLVLLVVTVGSTHTPAGVRLGVSAGIVVMLAGCVIGLVMIFNNSGVYQGSIGAGFGRSGAYLGPDAATVGREYLLLRPATAGGDLVLPHAIGVHGLILLAVPAVLLAATAARNQLRTVAVAVAGVTGAMAILLVHALRQLPLDALGVPALVALATCAAMVIAACAVVAAALVDHRRTADQNDHHPKDPAVGG